MSYIVNPQPQTKKKKKLGYEISICSGPVSNQNWGIGLFFIIKTERKTFFESFIKNLDD